MKSDSRQKVRNVIQGKPCESIVKGELCIDCDVVQSVCRTENRVGFAEKLEFIDWLGLDIVTIPPLNPRTDYGKNRLPEIEDFKWPDLEKWVSNTGLFTFALLDGPFEWGVRINGFEEFCVAVHGSGSSCASFIAHIDSLNRLLIEHVIGEGIDGVILADDIAHQYGLFVNPEVLRSMFIPGLAGQVEQIAQADLPVFFHSDGNYRPVITDLISAGFSGLHCLEKNAGMEISELRYRFEKKLCLWGHLEADDLEKSADPEYQAGLLNSIRRISEDSRFILGTASGVFNGMNLDRLRSIYHSV